LLLIFVMAFQYSLLNRLYLNRHTLFFIVFVSKSRPTAAVTDPRSTVSDVNLCPFLQQGPL
jgi:hypothetical protein